MKRKNFQKKLELNKQTVANLGIKELENARGGAEAFPTFDGDCTAGCTDEICSILDLCFTRGPYCTLVCIWD